VRSSSKTAAGALLGALLTVTLTACGTPAVTGPDREPGTEAPSASATATPDPVETPESEETPDPVPTPGQVIDASAKRTVPDGLIAFPLEGREYLVLDPAAPLPQQVVDTLSARAATIGPDASVGQAGRMSAETGKKVVLMITFVGALPDDESGNYYPVWECYTADGHLPPPVRSFAEALANAEAFVASQPDPAAWVIVHP